MTFVRIGVVVLVFIAVGAVVPEQLHAWTPGTHIYLGQSVLENLAMLPGGTADLLRASRRQMRCTRLWFTIQPSLRRSPVTRR